MILSTGELPAPGGACSGEVPALGGACSGGVGCLLRGGCLVLGRGCLVLGDAWSGGGWWIPPPGMATAAGGTYTTGMHSCYVDFHGCCRYLEKQTKVRSWNH